MTAGVKAIAKPVVKATPAAPLTNLEAKLDALLAKLKTEESSAATFVKKHWPIAAGLAVAATRFLHL